MHPARPAPDCSAIIVAAGSSRRLGTDKLVCPLLGVPVLRHSLDAFLAAHSISSIIVVCPLERWQLLDLPSFSKPITRVDGGQTRQDSVTKGLAALDLTTPWVAVHDGARPLITPNDIDRCVAAAINWGAAAMARRATETMQRSDADDFSAAPVSRDLLWCMETPQVFKHSLLTEACRSIAARKLSLTDEVSAVQSIGARVKFVESLHPNLKITTPADLALAEALLTQ